MTSYRLCAINKITKEDVYPSIAKKKDDYINIECFKDLTLCKGKKVRPYFRHKDDDDVPCNYYDSPNEGRVHEGCKNDTQNMIREKSSIDHLSQNAVNVIKKTNTKYKNSPKHQELNWSIILRIMRNSI